MFGSKNTDSSETTAPGIWGSWERAWDPRWALRCWSFLLFLDIMSLIYRKAGILAYYEQSAFEAQDLVWLFFVIAVFSMMVTFILPLCFTLVRDVLFQVFPARWFGQSGWKKPDSSVGSSKVLSEALESGDVFLYDYYKERRQKWKKENERTQDAVILILSAFLMILIAWRVSVSCGGFDGSILGQLYKVYERYTMVRRVFVIFAALGVFGAARYIYSAWFDGPDVNWIYHPPLRRKEDEEKNRRDGGHYVE
ncbi:hypothetical protein RYH70_16930 [Alloalcanivorax xenomutans]|uniref:hypothetical protein n=1 Tax=Alloalcanivorax xenomutans TaxID=1094342 RepID=UPI002935163F|nr:hypothetical protein [Alloalcanivorax xenomutans]WOD27692.1 hypothetical protein RYH70_16930 [Alloalcanivorax xenomutans]